MATTPDFSVAGKHVLITGGTGGIGGAFAKAFLDHGANIIVADVDSRSMGPIRAFDTYSWMCAALDDHIFARRRENRR